ncbi:hypothetical protein [Paracerasibacillus soli]|uniref:FTP domain-containing protein n=1 Tax=Paracerasibacillus soli TaxID=480284 RepID=A0ABU5CUX7_9BACI|nr:hypothetical protein [Virgibacillus soli]MDY0410184.1 hypothetical protein [Virgibacillus soli]
MKRKALPIFLTASLVFGGGLVPGSNVLASNQVAYDDDLKTPSYMIGSWDTPEGLSKEDAVYLFLQTKVLQPKGRSAENINVEINHAKDQFKIVDELSDSMTDTHHFRIIELHNGIPVYGSEQTVAVDKDNQVTAYFGTVTPNLMRSNISTDRHSKRMKL